MTGGQPDRDAVVRYLAHQAVTWHLLRVYRHHGLAGAVATLSVVGGCGRGGDGVFRVWETEAAGAPSPTGRAACAPPWCGYRCGRSWTGPTAGSPPATGGASRSWPPPATRRPLGCPTASGCAHPPSARPRVNALIFAAQRDCAAPERELAQIIHTALADQPRSGQQLNLFADAGM